MTEYEKLVKYASVLVDETNKSYLAGNHMAYASLILGIGPCMVEDYEGNGHCFRAVDDAIHNYYRSNPKSKANEGFLEGIDNALDRFPYTETFDTIMNYIKYELEKTKTGKNAFEFDGMEILTDMKLIIASNFSSLKSDPEFMFWLEEENEYFKKNYGYTLYK